MKELTYTPVIIPHSTQIIIENGLLGNTCLQLDKKYRRIALVSDSKVYPLYGKKLEQDLINAGFEVLTSVIKAGEQSKNLSTVERLYCDFSAGGLTRSDLVLALGGGVVGDIAGYAAATFLRGIKIIQIPTTLLAQVDSSVGGKTGVDLPSGKNRAGAFYQPEKVLIDPSVLSTLPKEQLACGFGEIIKYACIKNYELFQLLERGARPEDLTEVIYTCCSIKAKIVERDALDHGERMLLNFGHTVGHAIEKYYGYENIYHGQAVAAGMCALLPLCGERLGLKREDSGRIRDLCRQYDLPVKLEYDKAEILKTIAFDKKQENGNLNLVLLRKIGEACVVPVKTQELESYL